MKTLLAILMSTMTFSAQASAIGIIVNSGCFGGNYHSVQDIISLMSYIIGFELAVKIVLISTEKYKKKKNLNN